MRKGTKFEGEYPIYEGLEEFRKNEGDKPYLRWAREETIEKLKVGMWVEAEDGYFVPILRVMDVKQGASKFVRVPMGTFAVYNTKKGYHWTKLYAQFANGDMYRINGKQTNPDFVMERFVRYIIAGVHPNQAYNMVTGKKSVHATAKALHLIRTKEFMMELKNQITPFKAKLSEKFTEARIIKELESLLDNSRAGSQNHRENIKFIMEISGLIETEQKVIKSSKATEEAKFEEIPPPQIT